MDKQTARLLAEVEQRMGKKLRTPGDFDEMLLRMRMTTGDSLSLSTIKRVWGYVRSNSNTRLHTLSVLARFAGYEDWDDFLAHDGK